MVACVITLFFGVQTMALSSLGPPRALVGENQWSVGFNLSRQSMDLKTTGTYSEYQSPAGWYAKDVDFKIQGLGSTGLFGTIGHGITDNWDVFILLGFADADDEINVQESASGATQFFNGNETFALDSGFESAWGIGTRFTLLEQEDISWGGVFRVTWQDPKPDSDTWTDPADPTQSVAVEMDMDFWEMVIGIGPNLNLGDVWLYGGALLHLVRGDLKVTGTWTDATESDLLKASQDIEEESILGGYAGFQWNMAENVYWFADAEFTGNAWGVGLGALWRVE